MNLKKKLSLALIVFALAGILLVYNSPEENYRYVNDLCGTIKKGSSFSWLLFIGNKSWLLRKFDLTDHARLKLKNADIKEIVNVEILDKYQSSGGKYVNELRSVLYKGPHQIELVALERHEDYLAMTFSLQEGPRVPGKGKMLFSVVFRYYQPCNSSLWKKILRKVANVIPFCSSFGTTGRWVVADYNYTYNKSDYSAWYLREGDIVIRKKREETMNRLRNLNTEIGRQNFIGEVYTGMEILEWWASAWVERNPEHIDVGLFAKSNRLRKSYGIKSQ